MIPRYRFFLTLAIYLGMGLFTIRCSGEDNVTRQDADMGQGELDQSEEIPVVDLPSDEPVVDLPAQTDTQDESDLGTDPSPDTNPPPDFPLEPITEPVPFGVGVALGGIPVPIGIGTSGYGPSPGPASPFASRYPATTRTVLPLEAKVIALQGGMNRLILINLDLIGISAEARHSLAERLHQRTGLELGDSIIMGATHTHGGPGRLTTHPAYALAQDRFWPQFYDRFIEFLADLTIQALDNMEEGRFGYTFVYSNDLGHDRRCQSPEMMTGHMAILRFDDSQGTPLAAIVSYPIHGTFVAMSDFTLTGDSGGGIKYKLQEHFETFVPVFFFNSWGGDVAPNDLTSGSAIEPISSQQARCEALGNRAAEIVMPAFELIETSHDIEVASLTADIELSREAIGYTPEQWPHPYGGVYCGAGIEAACYGEGDPVDPDLLINACVPLFESWAVTYTSVGVARIGDLAIAAFPGEPCTGIGLQVVRDIEDVSGLEDVMFIGYAQDYCGYSETYEYWWAGGYETSGAIWGPRQGEYISSELRALATHLFSPESSQDIHRTQPPPRVIPSDSRVEYETEPSLELGAVLQDVPEELELGERIVFSFAGGDPWLGTPRVELEQYRSDQWQSVLRRNGTIIANDSYEFEILLEVSNPSYSEMLNHSPREFIWTAILPTERSEPSTNPPFVGRFRLRAAGLALVDEDVNDYEVFSSPFQVVD